MFWKIKKIMLGKKIMILGKILEKKKRVIFCEKQIILL